MNSEKLSCFWQVASETRIVIHRLWIKYFIDYKLNNSIKSYSWLVANIAVEMRSWEALFLLRFFDLRVRPELRIFLLIITWGLFTQLLIERFFSWGGGGEGVSWRSVFFNGEVGMGAVVALHEVIVLNRYLTSLVHQVRLKTKGKWR